MWDLLCTATCLQVCILPEDKARRWAREPRLGAGGGGWWAEVIRGVGGRLVRQGGMDSQWVWRRFDLCVQSEQKQVKVERRQAMDFCSGKFNAWKNIQKCIFLLLKNAHY